jgi:3',5'-nucleoside bisphosphate phosphatase
MRIDLHTHTTASDGTDTPAQLLERAVGAGLDVVAITDHDTTKGWEAAVAALPSGLILVRGMEMSCVGRSDDGLPVEVHLLAYLFDPNNQVFARERERLRAQRTVRLRTMAERMQADGLPIDPDEVMADTAVAGRPHLARALVTAGVVTTVDEAFAELLAADGPYYVAKADTPLDHAVDMVVAAGGVAVIAHCRARRRARLLSLDHIRALAGRGLGGIEVSHPDHGARDRAELTALADELHVVRTGSSDYHGANKTVGLGACTTELDQFDALSARATGVPVVTGR